MRALFDFGLAATDLTIGFLCVLRGRPVVAGILGFVGGALMIETLFGAR